MSEKSQQPLCLRKFHSKFVLDRAIYPKNERNSEGIFFDRQEVMKIKSKTPVMSYRQYRSYSLLCKWFRIAILPLDKPLETALLFRKDMKRCVVCGQPFLPGSNRAKYCNPCAAKVHRKQKNASDRKRRLLCGQLEAKTP